MITPILVPFGTPSSRARLGASVLAAVPLLVVDPAAFFLLLLLEQAPARSGGAMPPATAATRGPRFWVMVIEAPSADRRQVEQEQDLGGSVTGCGDEGLV